MSRRRRNPVWVCKGTKARPHEPFQVVLPKKTCETCGRQRPARAPLAHQLILEQPYDWWVDHFGSRCNICGRPAPPGKRLHRDHDHRTGEARGLLCHRCNRALPNWITVSWLQKAITYLLRARPNQPKGGT